MVLTFMGSMVATAAAPGHVACDLSPWMRGPTVVDASSAHWHEPTWPTRVRLGIQLPGPVEVPAVDGPLYATLITPVDAETQVLRLHTDGSGCRVEPIVVRTERYTVRNRFDTPVILETCLGSGLVVEDTDVFTVEVPADHPCRVWLPGHPGAILPSWSYEPTEYGGDGRWEGCLTHPTWDCWLSTFDVPGPP